MVKNMSKPKSYKSEFKFKVALEMIKGDLTISEIISRYQVPRSVLSKWKKQLLDNGAGIYGNRLKAGKEVDGREIERLHAVIGKLKVENDFLEEASARLM